MTFSSSVGHGTLTCDMFDKFSKFSKKTSCKSKGRIHILVRLQFPILALWSTQRVFNHIQPTSNYWSNGLYLLQIRNWKSFWVASISIVSSFPIFHSLLVLCIISQIVLLHLSWLKKKLVTFLSSKMTFAHPLFYIYQTSPNPLRLILMPHNMLLVPYLNREDAPLITTLKPFWGKEKI